MIDKTNESGIPVSLDQEKAFDRVHHEFIMKMLRKFGFGPSFCGWVELFCSNAYSRIIVNGSLSPPVRLHLETKVSLISCNVRVEWQAIALAVYGLGTIFSARNFFTFTKYVLIDWAEVRRAPSANRLVILEDVLDEGRVCLKALEKSLTLDLLLSIIRLV